MQPPVISTLSKRWWSQQVPFQREAFWQLGTVTLMHNSKVRISPVPLRSHFNAARSWTDTQPMWCRQRDKINDCDGPGWLQSCEPRRESTRATDPQAQRKNICKVNYESGFFILIIIGYLKKTFVVTYCRYSHRVSYRFINLLKRHLITGPSSSTVFFLLAFIFKYCFISCTFLLISFVILTLEIC